MTDERPKARCLWWSVILVGAGLTWAAQALVDPLRPAGVLLGPALALVGLIVELIRGGPWRKLILPCVLAATFSLSAQVRKEFRADSGAHFAYVRSLVFDGDLDFGNEWDRWGFEVRHRTATGLERNSQSAGPALLWSPAYLVTEVYLRLDRAITGTDRYPLDGYSAPYRRSAALATMTVVVIGAALLILMITPMLGARISTLAVVGGVLTSPVLYYALVVPTMAHGVTFGAAAALLWAWDRAHRTPSMRSWTVLGAAFGLVMICRWQGAVYGLLVLPLAVQGLARKKVRAVWLLAAAGAALLVFSPQLIAWKILFGQWITVPQGPGYLNFSSPHFLDTLISANHGFFNWTPVMLLGFLGLLFGMVRGSHPSRLLYFGSLLVFFATVWVNGSVTAWDWAAGDAFGARRFTLVVPLMALGLGSFLELSTRVLVRAPLLVPTAVLFLLFLWNVGMISHFRERKYREMAPLERVAKDQARSLRHLCQDILGWIAGDSGRAVAYEIFSAEYFYTRFNRSERRSGPFVVHSIPRPVCASHSKGPSTYPR
jgi:hypothetical protein